MDRQVLVEMIHPSSSPLRLAEGVDGKNLFMEGLAIQGDVKNHNGRVYPVSEIRKAVEEVNKRISKSGPIIGECDHPEGLNVNIQKGSHLIEKMWMSDDGKAGMARFKIVPVGYGEVISGFIQAGAVLGVSSRGSGNVDPNGNVSDFDLVTIDVVANPSAPDAYPAPLWESIQGSNHGREAMMLSECVRHDPKAQKYLEREILAFIQELNPRKHT